MNEQTSISTTDEHLPNSITYEQFYKSIELLFDTTNNNSSSTTDNGSLIPIHTILPFTIKPNSSAIYHVEEEINI